MQRREFLRLSAAAAAGVVAGCSSSSNRVTSASTTTHLKMPSNAITSGDPEVIAREALREVAGAPTVERALLARPAPIEIAEPTKPVQTWAYNDTIPGPLLRAEAGSTLIVPLANDLPDVTTVHWHGLTLRNDMDGQHHLGNHSVRSESSFTYHFIVDTPGTFWYHPHVGLQLDRGLYGPLIVDDPNDPGDYDREHIVMLDDWIDGIGPTPERVFETLGGDAPTVRGSRWLGRHYADELGGDSGSIAYPSHLINGRTPAKRMTLPSPTDAVVKLRVINAATETAYRFGVVGLPMLVTDADAFGVQPVVVDQFVIGPGERYDVRVRVTSGTWPLIAVPLGKPGHAEALLRTLDAMMLQRATPAVGTSTAKLTGRTLLYDDLVATPQARLQFARPDTHHAITLTGRNAQYHWGLNGEPFGANGSINVRQNEHTRLTVTNTTALWHPMHLHGHTFRMGTRQDSPRKDTVIIRPGESATFDVVCDNPGQWMLHCHNGYHMQSGMAIPFSYVR